MSTFTTNRDRSRGLLFEQSTAVVPPDPNRTDITCFVGFVNRRPDVPVMASIQRWLYERQWACTDNPLETDPDCSHTPYHREPIESLLDVPVPIDRWEVFDLLFDWDRRDAVSGQSTGGTYLGAAVRSFFSQGGRKCYVVRVGDAWPFDTPRSTREAEIEKLLPGYPRTVSGSPVDPRSWHGVGHLFGLPDVAMLSMPDLVSIFAADAPPLSIPRYTRSFPERFVECGSYEPSSPDDRPPTPSFAAPRCDDDGYQQWASAISMVASMIAYHQREVQLIASLPIPAPGAQASHNLIEYLNGDHEDSWLSRQLNDNTGLSSAFVQLVYPWVRSPGSTGLPEQLESPDAVLAGILANHALTRGSFRSAANLSVGDVYGLDPLLSQQAIEQISATDEHGLSLPERVTLLGPTPSGLRVLSDVTTSLDRRYRFASVNRLMASVLRAARRLGESITFEPSGPEIWHTLRSNLESLMRGLFEAGALRGKSADSAFSVRCDRTTMSQNDIDQGRVIASIQFDAAVPIDTIRVLLTISEGGRDVRIAPEKEAS